MPEIRTTPCRSCGALVVWMRTSRGKNMPVDADTVDEAALEFEDEKPLFDAEEHSSHFSTCPDADGWRR